MRFARALCSSPDGHRTAFAKSFTQLPGHQLRGHQLRGHQLPGHPRPGTTFDRVCVFRLPSFFKAAPAAPRSRKQEQVHARAGRAGLRDAGQ